MKQKLLIPALTILGGAAAFILRMLQNHSGFERDTGLAIPGTFAGRLLPALLAALAVAFFLLSRKAPKKEDGVDFPAAFPFCDAAALLLPVMGVFLMGISGAADMAMGLRVLSGAVWGVRMHLILGGLSIVSAVGLFLAAAACRRKRASFPAMGLLPVILMLVLRLIVTYRSVSTDPTLAAYYVELMVLVCLTMAFFRLAGFAYLDASPRGFLFFAPMAVVFSMTAIAEISRTTLPSLALYVGGALVILGFLMAYLLKDTTKPTTEQDECPDETV